MSAASHQLACNGNHFLHKPSRLAHVYVRAFCPLLTPVPPRPAHSSTSQAPAKAWIEIAQEVFDTLRIPALDPKLWDRTWELEKLKEEIFTINPGEEQIIEERLFQFFDQEGDKFYCRIPVNHPNTGQSYCNHALGRKYRILGHLRAHLNFRPFVCGGDCSNADW